MRLLAAMALMLVAAAALGQPESESNEAAGARAGFLKLDRDGDGHLNRIEVLADSEIAKRFMLFDLNRDGLLSEDEYTRAKEHYEQRMRRDIALTARVKAALLAEKGVPSRQIRVESYEGRVLLSGFVESPDMVSRAGRVAATVSGVRIVRNHIAVK
jgi:hyperosmotically inducible periplasmic protein